MAEFLGPLIVIVAIVFSSWIIQYKLLQHIHKIYFKVVLGVFWLLFIPGGIIYMENCNGFLCEIGGALLMYAGGLGLLGCLFGFIHFIVKKRWVDKQNKEIH